MNNDVKKHPLEFYALGKVNDKILKNNYSYNNISTLISKNLGSSNTSSDIFRRNISSLNNLSIKVNNIPDKTQSIGKYENMNSLNSLEWFNLIKKKLYNADNSKNLKLLSGKNISRSEFYEEKNKGTPIPPIEKTISSYRDNKKAIGFDYNYNVQLNENYDNIINCKRFKKENDKMNKIFLKNKPIKEENYWKKVKLVKNKSFEKVSNENKNQLKSSLLHFFQNNKEIVRHRDYWKIEK